MNKKAEIEEEGVKELEKTKKEKWFTDLSPEEIERVIAIMKVKWKIKTRQENICYFCPERISDKKGIHHIIPKRLSGEITEKNCVGVCDECHRKLDRINSLWETYFKKELNYALGEKEE